MITLDEFNAHWVVAHDAELEGKHDSAKQIRGNAWQLLGLSSQLQVNWIDVTGGMVSLLMEAAARGIIARGYTFQDCMMFHYQDTPLRQTLAVKQQHTIQMHTVLDLTHGYVNPGPRNMQRQLEYGVRWLGPWWPVWKIDPGESAAWLHYQLADAQRIVDSWCADRPHERPRKVTL